MELVRHGPCQRGRPQPVLLRLETNVPIMAISPARLDIRLTPEGRQELEARLAAYEAERPVLAEQIGNAREGGFDPTENLDLRDAIDSLQILEARISELRATLAAAEPLAKPLDDGTASLGASVRVRLDDGEETDYRLVSPAEADPRRGRLSIASPVGQALLGHRPGDRIEALTPAGSTSLQVLRVA